MKKILVLLICFALLLSACSTANGTPDTQTTSPSEEASQSESETQPEPEPEPEPESEPEIDNEWQFDLPENHQMAPEVFEQLHAALPGSGIRSVVTVKDGVIIDEYYADGYNENSVFELHSCSKSFTSALIGIAIEEGYMGGVDDLLSDYLPQVLEQEDERKHTLTLRDLLTQTSGLEWYEWGSGYHNWEEFRSATDWVEYILSQRLIYEPGTVFNYSTGNTHLLAAALEQAVGTDALTYGREHIFDPMGMESVDWGTGPEGVIDGGNGILMTARDAAKFGQLFLQNGQWQGKQLVPAGWVEESTSVQNAGPGGTGQYGYQWWITPYTSGQYGTHATQYPSGTYDTYFAFGWAGQMIYVVPELDLVTVFTSMAQSSYAPRPYFTDYVLNAYMG